MNDMRQLKTNRIVVKKYKLYIIQMRFFLHKSQIDIQQF